MIGDLPKRLPEKCERCGLVVWHRVDPCTNCAPAATDWKAEHLALLDAYALVEEERNTYRARADRLEAALHTFSRDPHQASARPCPTCPAISAALGRPFGCDAHPGRKARR